MAKFCTQTGDDHVQNICFFISIGVVVTKIMTFFQKCVQVGRSGYLRSVGGTWAVQPAGWLAAAAYVDRYSDVAGVSQSDWPMRVQ